MMPQELFYTVAFIATIHVVLGLFVGNFLGRRRDMHVRDAESAPSLPQAQCSIRSLDELGSHLANLVTLSRQLQDESCIDRQEDLDSFRSILKRAILALRTSEDAPPANRSIAEPAEAHGPDASHDTAELSGEQWFPAQQSEAVQERRTTRRFSYERVQLVAPVIGSELPKPEDFVEVLFQDLSADGFSFFAAEELDCKQVVAKLGATPHIVPVLARVVHQRRAQRDDQPSYLVGCRIVRRLSLAELDKTRRVKDRAKPVQLEFALSA
jgi:hypothetical protein